MKKNLRYILSTSFLTMGLLSSTLAYANFGGVVGRSGNPATPLTDTGKDCNLCHAGGLAPEVVFKGPSVVEQGTTNSYQLIMTAGQKVNGGFNVSVENGVLVNTSSRTKILPIDVTGLPDEITHVGALIVSTDGTGTIVWEFDWTAPATPRTVKMYGAVMSGDESADPSGDSASSLILDITVSATAPKPSAPIAVIDAQKSANVNTAVSFSASKSTDADDNIVSYKWKFSDGSSADGETVQQKFTSVKVVTASLTVTDATDLTHTTFVDVNIVDVANGGSLYPIAIINSATKGSTMAAIDFTAAVIDSTDPVKYLWDFGDGSTIEAATTTALTPHTFTKPGTYIVRLVAQTDNNLLGIISKQVTVTQGNVEPVNPAKQLYLDNCSACHGSGGIPNTAKNVKGATLLLIEESIATGLPTSVPEMSMISLTAVELQQIADYLGSTTDTSGMALFVTRCELCHGVAGVGASAKMITGATAQQIENAILPASQTAVLLMAGIKVTAAEAISIERYLAVDVQGGTGKSLYDATCLQCHGPDGTGGSAKMILNRTFAEIKAAYANTKIPEMQAIIVLTDTEIQLVADFLVRAVSGDVIAGEQSFITNCQECHGTGAGGYALPVLNASVQMTNDAIDQNSMTAVAEMSNIKLTPLDTQNVVAFLAAGGLVKPTTGNELYVMYCSYCHGIDGQGTNIAGAIRGKGVTADLIAQALNGGQKEMTNSYLSKILTTADIQLIANTL